MPGPMHDFQSLEIAEVKRETPEAVSFTFAIPEALRDAFRFKPGQHLPVRATQSGFASMTARVANSASVRSPVSRVVPRNWSVPAERSTPQTS